MHRRHRTVEFKKSSALASTAPSRHSNAISGPDETPQAEGLSRVIRNSPSVSWSPSSPAVSWPVKRPYDLRHAGISFPPKGD